jgi:hypothetical protein
MLVLFHILLDIYGQLIVTLMCVHFKVAHLYVVLNCCLVEFIYRYFFNR